jgi:hypothetical protein
MAEEGNKYATLERVNLMWAHLDKPNEHNDNPKFEIELTNLTEEHLAQLKALDPSYTPNDGAKKVDKDGKSKEAKGFYCCPKSSRPVPVFDSVPNNMHISLIKKIGNGSVGNVKIHSYTYTKPKKGVALGLDEVQIVEYVEYDSGAGSFNKVDEGFVAPPVEEDNVPY